MASQFPDELTRTVTQAAQNLSTCQKADFLLQTALSMIEEGRYGDEVEHYLEVFLATSDTDGEKVSRALLARGNARRAAADKLLTRAHQDFQAVAKLDPTNRVMMSQIRQDYSPFSTPAHRRTPPEIWEMIASHIPRFHLRTWLFVSRFHRGIAWRLIFRTIDVYFGEDHDNLDRGLDIFDRAKQDPLFAKMVKTLRIHWRSYEEEDLLLDLLKRLFREALPAFRSLQEFEWIGYPEMKKDMIKAVLATHPHLHGLGIIGWHFDAVGVTGFRNLRHFTLRAEDDDGDADMGEVREVIDQNQRSLVHLTLGADLMRPHSWDLAFESVTIQKLTHLDLVDTRITHSVLACITHAQYLQSLTLHGTFVEPGAASVVFGSDHVIGGQHTFLPHLQAFRFIMVDHDKEILLFQNVVLFLRKRTRLRRLDLGDCPWNLVKKLLIDLTGLRVLRVRIPTLGDRAAWDLVDALPSNMLAMHLSIDRSDQPINTYAGYFSRFFALSMLHLASTSARRPQPNLLTDKEFQFQSDFWTAQAKTIPSVLLPLDFLGWHGEHYVVVRNETDKRIVELKELPARQKLDCGKGVDLGSEDTSWMERKDVPIHYDMAGLEC